MENELQVIDELRQPMAIGEVFAKSGMFPDVKSQAQAVVKILAGKGCFVANELKYVCQIPPSLEETTFFETFTLRDFYPNPNM